MRTPFAAAVVTMGANTVATAALCLLAISLLLAIVVRLGISRLTRESTRESRLYPPVSILKPLKGADPGLESNLLTFFTQDYPSFELLFGVADGDDPAISTVRALMRRYPNVHAKLVIDGRRSCANPKVANLANIAPYASHELLLISDSNVRIMPGYLSDMVARIEDDESVGLVTSAFAARSESGLGGALERLHLNSFNAGGMSASNWYFGQPVSVGKSQLLRRSHLEAVGGWPFLGRFLAEDQVLALETARLGRKVAQASQVIGNVIGQCPMATFIDRQTRWASLRFRLLGPLYLGELLFQTAFVALVAIALSPTLLVLCAAIGVVIAKALFDEGADAAMAPRRFGPLALLLAPLKDFLLAYVWFRGIFRNQVSWRGANFRIGARTLLKGEPTSPTAPAPTLVVSSHGAISSASGAHRAISAARIAQAMEAQVSARPSAPVPSLSRSRKAVVSEAPDFAEIVALVGERP